MAKETNIIFLYDTELLKREEDDPNSAILYFYPTWVSDQQKTALCGQLMGTMLCLKDIFSTPKVISLQTGRFFLIENGRFILVIGTDRNIQDEVLEQRATFIYSLVNFFHKDFITLAQCYQDDNLNAKLYHIFDTYLKLMFLGGGIFNFIPLLEAYKTESDIFTNGKEILNNLKIIPHFLGGMLLYHNKVLHTQFSVEVSKKIVFSDPFRIKNPAEIKELNFELPPGVKLLQVYIPPQDFEELHDVSQNNLTSTSSIKRDTSLLFTAVPEDSSYSPEKDKVNKKSKKSRPNSLNLKSFSLDSGGKTPGTPYWNQSLVSTPFTETKTFVDKPESENKKQRQSLDIFNYYLQKTLQFSVVINCSLIETTIRHSNSLRDLFEASKNSITSQYFSVRTLNNNSFKLKRCKSIHDPLFPWCRGRTAVSQYYVEQVLQGGRFADEKGLKQRKESLTLPIKPHNTGGTPKYDKNFPGFCTSLMNELSINDSSGKSKIVSMPHFIKKEFFEPAKQLELKKSILFMYGVGDLVLASLLTEACLANNASIEQMYEQCSEHLPALEEQIKSSINLSKVGTGTNESSSVLYFDKCWGTTKKSGLWDEANLSSLTRLHGDFGRNEEIKEIFVRKTDSVLYAQRDGSTELFYHELAPSAGGLLPPNDALSSIQQTARNELQDHKTKPN